MTDSPEIQSAAEAREASPGPAPGDIVFDCPYCGKSLAIEERGAGLVIHCPDCGKEVQVPGLPLHERESLADERAEPSVEAVDLPVEELAAALEASHTKIERLVTNLEEVRDRRRHLEKVRVDNMARFEQIGQELVTIQNALDRIVTIIQDAGVEDVGDEDIPLGG